MTSDSRTMSDDGSRVPERRDNSSVYAALESLRDDVREDIASLRSQVRQDLAASESRLMATFTGYTVAHAADHDSHSKTSDAAHMRFDAWIRAAELAQARRDGALGVFRFVLAELSRNWKPLTAIITSIAVGTAFVTGSIGIQVMAR